MTGDMDGFGGYVDAGLPPGVAIDEPALRRPGWQAFREFVGLDGQTWGLPRIGPLEALLIPGLHDMIVGIPPEESPDYGPDMDMQLTRIGWRLLALNYQLEPRRTVALCMLQDRRDLNRAILDILADGSDWWRMTSPYRHDGVISFFN